MIDIEGKMSRNKLMIMGPDSGSGKTILSIGLCRALVNSGIKVAPFKAVSIIPLDHHIITSVPMYAHGVIYHCGAACLPFETAMNPVVVRQTGEMNGDLYINGDIVGSATFVNEDTLLFGKLSPDLQKKISEAVENAFQALTKKYDFVIIEGAGCPVDIPENEDIPNIMTARLAKAPIIFSCRLTRGGMGAALVGTGLCLPEDIRGLLRGFIFSNLKDEAILNHSRQLVESYLSIPLIGVLPCLNIWQSTPEDTYQILADAVVRHLNLNLIVGL